MRTILLLSAILVSAFGASAQYSPTSSFDLVHIARYIDTMTSVKVIEQTATLCPVNGQPCRKDSITYRFTYDSIENKLLKVAIINNNSKKKKEYYFSKDRLIAVRGDEKYLIKCFNEIAFSYGNTYKDKKAKQLAQEDDLEIATSYKFLIAFNDMRQQTR